MDQVRVMRVLRYSNVVLFMAASVSRFIEELRKTGAKDAQDTLPEYVELMLASGPHNPAGFPCYVDPPRCTAKSARPRVLVLRSWTQPSGGTASSKGIDIDATLWEHDPSAMRDATLLHNDALRGVAQAPRLGGDFYPRPQQQRRLLLHGLPGPTGRRQLVPGGPARPAQIGLALLDARAPGRLE